MYTIQEVSRKTGLSAHTLRYYEKEGLLAGVERTQGGIRQYSDEDLEALGLICCLKNTGMPLQAISRFMKLTQKGEFTLKERVELLREHKDNVQAHIDELERYLEKVSQKLQHYTDMLNAYETRTEHGSQPGL